MKDKGYYAKRFRTDDSISRLISIIRLLIFISVAFAFALGVLATRYYQSSGAPLAPEDTTSPTPEPKSFPPSASTPEAPESNSEEERSPPNSEGFDSGGRSEESL